MQPHLGRFLIALILLSSLTGCHGHNRVSSDDGGGLVNVAQETAFMYGPPSSTSTLPGKLGGASGGQSVVRYLGRISGERHQPTRPLS